VGMSYDCFVAPDDGAALTWPDGKDCESWPTVSLGRADPEEFLAPLHDLLRGGDGSAYDTTPFVVPLGDPDDSGDAWVVKLPADFVTVLETCGEARQQQAVETWADIYAGLDAEDAADLLSEFAEFASEGKRLGYSMYCYISL
jgi:hypothetical protein